MTTQEVIAAIVAQNPRASLSDVYLYAETFVQWQEASANVRRLGSVVAHPRTDEPIENPYVKIMASTTRTLRSFTRLRTDQLWKNAQTQTKESDA
jgi:phage terminase small subunit